VIAHTSAHEGDVSVKNNSCVLYSYLDK